MKYKYKYREVQFDNIQDAVLYKIYDFSHIRELELFVNIKYNKIKNIVSTYYNDDLYLKNDWAFNSGISTDVFVIKYGFLNSKSATLSIAKTLEILKSTPEYKEECNIIEKLSKELYCGNKLAGKMCDYSLKTEDIISSLADYNKTYGRRGCPIQWVKLHDNSIDNHYFTITTNSIEFRSDKSELEFTIKATHPTLDIETYIVTPPEVTIEPVGIKYSSEEIYELVNKLFDKIDKEYEDKQNQIACHKDKELDLVRRFEEC